MKTGESDIPVDNLLAAGLNRVPWHQQDGGETTNISGLFRWLDILLS